MRIAFPHKSGAGGPGSFQLRFENELKNIGWEVCYPEDNLLPDIVMVIGGTKKLLWLWRLRRKNIPILYRMDGLSWLHRKVRMPVKVFFENEIRNVLQYIIRTFFADTVIYQSDFVEKWWKRKGWKTNAKHHIIYNGVNLKEFSPRSESKNFISLICLEGTIDYSPYAVKLLNYVADSLIRSRPDIRLKVYGEFSNGERQKQLSSHIEYYGKVQRKDVPSVLQNGIYLSLDVHPACPNTVIEALACGLPVVAFDTGSLKELVPEKAGIIVDYGSDPWKLDFPDANALIDAILRIADNWDCYNRGAREVAEGRYSIEYIMAKYLSVIEGTILRA